MYSLTSPYGHLSNGQFVWSQKCQKSYTPNLYNTNTSVKWTVIGSVPLVSVLKRFDCIGIFLPLSKLKKLNDLRLFIVLCSTLHCISVTWLYTVMLFTCKGTCNLDISPTLHVTPASSFIDHSLSSCIFNLFYLFL